MSTLTPADLDALANEVIWRQQGDRRPPYAVVAPPAPDTIAGQIAAAHERKRQERIAAAARAEDELRARLAREYAERAPIREAAQRELTQLEPRLAELEQCQRTIMAKLLPLRDRVRQIREDATR